MTSLIASLVLAAALPSDFLDSVGIAAYWYRKDSRGRGDSISEQEKPRRFPAFAISDDTFLVADPLVRTNHLDRIELWYGDRRISAKEVARGVNPDTVMIRTERPVEGIRPLVFEKGEPVERLTWSWTGDSLNVTSSEVGTNTDVKAEAVSRRIFHQGKPNSLLLDRDRRPVALDFGEFSFVEGGRFEYGDVVGRCTLPADGFERESVVAEERVARAVLPIVIRLEQQEKDDRRRRSWDGPAASSETEALGVVLGGRVLVPSELSGEDISRFKCAEATFADGSRTNLVFAGALAEWNAIVFDLPRECVGRVGSLDICAAGPDAMLGERAWAVTAENEGGRPLVTALRGRFLGLEFLRGAKFVAGASFVLPDYSYSYGSGGRESEISFVTTADGAVASLELKRRYGSRYAYAQRIGPADLADALAGKAYNEEFRPRAEEDRNRIVWLGVETVELTDALASEKKAQSFTERYSRPPLVTEVYPGSPCAKAGIVAGDILLAYRRGSEREQRFSSSGDYSGRDWSMYFGASEIYSYFGITATPWTDVEGGSNRDLSKYGVGAKLTVVYVRDGRRQETELTLEAAPPHYKNAPKSRNRALGTLVKDMTFEVRRFFKFDEKEPGVVIAKIKPGSPAAVAGLKVYELITEVNGEKVTGAKDFAAKIKDREELVFTVRRLSQTRMVKIRVPR